MLINRIPLRRLVNHHRLLKFEQHSKLLQRSASHGNSSVYEEPEWWHNLYAKHPPLLYRDIGDSQDRIDWWGSMFLIAIAVASSAINVYMNWSEYQLIHTPGYDPDVSRFTDAELGIPPDDLGYAPLNPEVVKQGRVLQLGNTQRSDNRQVYHAYMLRHGLDSPYDL